MNCLTHRKVAAALALLCSCASQGSAASEIRPRTIAVGAFEFDALQAGPAGGELVLLLHGFPQTSHSFRHQLVALAEAGYLAVAPNQRGYSPGARPAEVEAYTIPKLVTDVLEIADALDRDRFHVVGHDWGAAVAWFTAMSAPQRVMSVAALSIAHPFAFTAAMADPNSDQAQRSSYMQRFREAGSEDWFLADDAEVLRGLYESPGIAPEDVDVYLETLGTPEALGAALNWYRAMGLPAQYGNLTPIGMPALYIWSTADSAMGREGAEATADFVEGPYHFEVLEGVSHWVPEEASATVNRLLVEHLYALPRSPLSGR